MIKQHSWTRRQYEIAYRQFRRGFQFETIRFKTRIPLEVTKAADYSYQALDYAVSGWINDRRYNRFMVIKWRINTKRFAPENNPPPIQIDIDRW